ncbi:hypothetical protein AYJ54_00715 [Bradyrhizobium centrolobii]|uniref:Uncharacterized protein n=1 Tax=Bradyrhizobium centrolobii TaxID=1505087 RepID=A0A176YGY8_9BRAD|nr:hypothetical protein [Bradyrhizobium centrolobii]OAF05460.1 hypothetical protein AYJ54_00715 [Bradyrhizobium centrolobii]
MSVLVGNESDFLKTELHVDQSENTFTIYREQDVEPHLDFNKYLQTLRQKSDWGRHVAHIPNIFYEQWLREEWNAGNTELRPFTPEFDALVERKIQDPDWKFLRVDSPMVAGWLGFGS